MYLLDYIKQNICNEISKLKKMSAKEKTEFIWEYYKVPICIILVLVILFGSMIRNFFNPETVFLQNAIINLPTADMGEPEPLTLGFQKAMDLPEDDVILNYFYYMSFEEDDYRTDYQTAQKIMVMAVSQELDILLMGEPELENLTSWGIYGNLAEMLPADLWEQVKEYAIFVTDSESGIPYPAALDVRNSSVIKNCNFASDSVVLCVAANAPRLENIVQMIRYLFS